MRAWTNEQCALLLLCRKRPSSKRQRRMEVFAAATIVRFTIQQLSRPADWLVRPVASSGPQLLEGAQCSWECGRRTSAHLDTSLCFGFTKGIIASSNFLVQGRTQTPDLVCSHRCIRFAWAGMSYRGYMLFIKGNWYWSWNFVPKFGFFRETSVFMC
jgi:hypothetical protein